MPRDCQPNRRPHLEPNRHVLAAVSLFAVFAFAASALLGDAAENDLGRRLDAIFAQAYPADEPGAAVLVRRGDEVLLRQGYGMADLELGVAIAPDMVFRLGSITKQFTAVAILMLEQEGKLSVSDPITKHLPDYPEVGQTITIAHLLTHTSGIPSYTDDPDFLGMVRDDLSVAEMIDTFDDEALLFEPGSTWRYNNSGYFLLGAIIEAASGQTYEAFLESRIFGPLDMARSDYGSPGRVIPRRVRGYHRDDEDYVNAPYMSMSLPYAAGSLLSTVDDLARWDAAIDTDTLLPATARERLFNRAVLSDGETVDYGYGWTIHDLDGRPAAGHGGGIFGFSTMVLRVPEERLFVAVLSNNPGKQPGPGLLARQAVDMVLGRSTSAAGRFEPASLDDYLGVYRIDDDTTRAVMVGDDGRLFTQRTGGGRAVPEAIGEDQFLYTDDLTRARFVRNAQGRVTHMIVQPWGGREERADRTDEPLPEPPKRAQVDPAIYERYAGDYELVPGLVLNVRREGDKLMTQATGQGAIELFPESETVFFNEMIGARVTFTVDGDAVGLVLEQGGQRIESERQEP